MVDATVRRRGFYLLPNEDRVVVVTALTDTHVTAEDPTDGTTWTVRRGPFEAELDAGRIVRVSPNWEPAGGVTV